jgi:hypothetical protein
MFEWRQCKGGHQWLTTEHLEHPNMEDIKDVCSVGELQAVGLADTFQHLERPSIVWDELSFGSRHQGLCWAMQEPELDPVVDVELQWLMINNIVALGIGLSLQEAVTDVSKEGVVVL